MNLQERRKETSVIPHCSFVFTFTEPPKIKRKSNVPRINHVEYTDEIIHALKNPAKINIQTKNSTVNDSAGNAPNDSAGNAPHDSAGNAPHDSAGNAPHDSPGNAPHDSPGNAPHDSPESDIFNDAGDDYHFSNAGWNPLSAGLSANATDGNPVNLSTHDLPDSPDFEDEFLQPVDKLGLNLSNDMDYYYESSDDEQQPNKKIKTNTNKEFAQVSKVFKEKYGKEFD